jgi:energy-coupling factor transport system ATP-binding protein
MLDPLSRQEITALLHQLHQERNLTLIQITHLLEEAALAQRVVVMEQGQVVLDGPPAMIFRDLDQLRALKLEIPEPLLLAERLRRAGVPLSAEAITLSAIAEELAP